MLFLIVCTSDLTILMFSLLAFQHASYSYTVLVLGEIIPLSVLCTDGILYILVRMYNITVQYIQYILVVQVIASSFCFLTRAYFTEQLDKQIMHINNY